MLCEPLRKMKNRALLRGVDPGVLGVHDRTCRSGCCPGEGCGPSGEPKRPVELSALGAEKMTRSLTEGVRSGRSLLMTKSFLSQGGKRGLGPGVGWISCPGGWNPVSATSLGLTTVPGSCRGEDPGSSRGLRTPGRRRGPRGWETSRCHPLPEQSPAGRSC